MPVTFELPGALRDLNDGRRSVELEGTPATVGEALEALRRQRAGLYDRIVTERGELRTHVNLFVGGEEIRGTGGFGTPLREEDAILVVPAVSGG